MHHKKNISNQDSRKSDSSFTFQFQYIQNLQTLLITLCLRMVILLMPHCQPLLHELLTALGVDADAHWVAGRRGIVTEDLPHLVKQSDG